MRTNLSKKPLVTDASLLKQINYARILGLLRRQPRLTRAEIARQTGLTRSTVTVITGELITAGLIREGQETTVGAVGGRPGVEIELNPDGAFFIGAAIGVEDIRVVELNLAAQVVNRIQEPIGENKSPEALIDRLIGMIRQIRQSNPLSEERSRGVGITVPGTLNLEGVVILAPMLEWRDVDLRTYLKSHLDLPLFIDNDANAAALAEVYLGSAMYCKSLLYLLLDFGVGGGIVLDNRVWRGTHGTASEVSDLMLDPYTSRKCEGERPGSLGAFCSKTGLLTHYHEQSGEPADFKVLLTRLEQKNAIAQSVIQEWGQFLGLGLIGLVNILNPERVVFGGQLAMLLPYVQDRLDDMLRNCLPGNQGYGFSGDATCVLEISQFGGESAAMGGAVLVYQSLFQVPDLVLLGG